MIAVELERFGVGEVTVGLTAEPELGPGPGVSGLGVDEGEE